MEISVLLTECDECQRPTQTIFSIGFKKGTLTLCLGCLVNLNNNVAEALSVHGEGDGEEPPEAKETVKMVRFKVYPCRYCKECRPFTKLGLEQIEVHEVTDHPDDYRPITKPQIRENSWRTRKIETKTS